MVPGASNVPLTEEAITGSLPIVSGVTHISIQQLDNNTSNATSDPIYRPTVESFPQKPAPQRLKSTEAAKNDVMRGYGRRSGHEDVVPTFKVDDHHFLHYRVEEMENRTPHPEEWTIINNIPFFDATKALGNPNKFSMPHMKNYIRKDNHIDHVREYTTHMKFLGTSPIQ
ncbi:hypothetical protein Fot_32192 [Forsythia ovata]|uniref:Uncharacterized protein n=1 Tax=Forsythia ovata TaxID=205694 RepID=A0ABD1T742_9LAMI